MTEDPNTALQQETETEPEIQFIELAPAIEFCCWVVVFLAPILRWINGAAVTEDQWWIQVFLFSTAVVGACSLRICQIVMHRKEAPENSA